MEPADFAKRVWDTYGSSEPFEPEVHYDPDGDCLEFLAINDAFKGERIDKFATVYRSRKTGEVIGSLIKNVRELLSKNPGLRIEIQSGPVKLSQVLIGAKFTATTALAVRVYQEIIERAERVDAEADLACASDR